MATPRSHRKLDPSCPCLHLRACACPCTLAPPPHALMHSITKHSTDARPPRDNALRSQRLGAPIGRQGARLAPLVARIGDHGRSRRLTRSAAAHSFELRSRLVCLPVLVVVRPFLPLPDPTVAFLLAATSKRVRVLVVVTRAVTPASGAATAAAIACLKTRSATPHVTAIATGDMLAPSNMPTSGARLQRTPSHSLYLCVNNASVI